MALALAEALRVGGDITVNLFGAGEVSSVVLVTIDDG
jgi:hypothetical protein